LKQIRSAGWRTPASHQDLDPAHEAMQLREAFQEALRLTGTHDRPAEVGHGLADAVRKAESLEMRLRAGAAPPALDQAFNDTGASCTRCHAKYRDVSKSP
jgi:hypothetical protein